VKDTESIQTQDISIFFHAAWIWTSFSTCTSVL